MGTAGPDGASPDRPADGAAQDGADDPTTHSDEHGVRSRLAARGSELRSAAAARSSELRSQAAAKGSELRAQAAATGNRLRTQAAAKSVELRAQAAHRAAEVQQAIREMDVPWARCRLARVARESILQMLLAPLMDRYVRLRVTGREQFRMVEPPVVLVANHSSHLDTLTVLRALPLKWRQRTAVAAAADYFYKHRAVASAVALAFNTVPVLRRTGAGASNGSLAHVDRLIEQRWNLLMFPEGTRSREGTLGRLRTGAAVIAHKHDIPIVPVRLEGTFDAMPPGRLWPRRASPMRRHEVSVTFGPPLWPERDESARAFMERLRPFLERGPDRETSHT
jgi:1-acyl-sn-glycerol-3-phosphate acyltransferase